MEKLLSYSPPEALLLDIVYEACILSAQSVSSSGEDLDSPGELVDPWS